MDPATIADLVVVSHLLFASFIVLGFGLIPLGAWRDWRWVRNIPLRLSHLAAIAFVAAESALGMVCPLTSLENQLRVAAGAQGDDSAFIARIASRLLFYQFPDWVFGLIYGLLTLLALYFLWLVPPKRRRR